MRGRFFRGLAAGTLLGAAAGMLFMPSMDRKTRKRITRAGRNLVGLTEDLWEGIRDFRR